MGAAFQIAMTDRFGEGFFCYLLRFTPFSKRLENVCLCGILPSVNPFPIPSPIEITISIKQAPSMYYTGDKAKFQLVKQKIVS